MRRSMSAMIIDGHTRSKHPVSFTPLSGPSHLTFFQHSADTGWVKRRLFFIAITAGLLITGGRSIVAPPEDETVCSVTALGASCGGGTCINPTLIRIGNTGQKDQTSIAVTFPEAFASALPPHPP